MEGTMFNFILGAMFAINMALTGSLYTSFNNRQNKHGLKIQELEVLISGKYQLKDEAAAVQEKVFNKLDLIQNTVTNGHAKLQQDISASHMELQKDINTSHTELQKDINSCKAEHYSRRRGDGKSEGD